MKPSKRELWREVERLDEEIPPARDNDDTDEWTEEMLAAIFEDDEEGTDGEEALEELQETADELF
jgi:hypothetical protein